MHETVGRSPPSPFCLFLLLPPDITSAFVSAAVGQVDSLPGFTRHRYRCNPSTIKWLPSPVLHSPSTMPVIPATAPSPSPVRPTLTPSLARPHPHPIYHKLKVLAPPPLRQVTAANNVVPIVCEVEQPD
jgi:hypothetical protein